MNICPTFTDSGSATGSPRDQLCHILITVMKTNTVALDSQAASRRSDNKLKADSGINHKLRTVTFSFCHHDCLATDAAPLPKNTVFVTSRNTNFACYSFINSLTSQSQPQDSDKSDGKQHASNCNNSNVHQRSKVTGRKPLQNRPNPNKFSNGNEDDEKGDDRDPNKRIKTILSRCEQDDPDEPEPCPKKTRTSLPGRIRPETAGVVDKDPFITDPKPNASMMSETSFFKFIGYARSWMSGPNKLSDESVNEADNTSVLEVTLPHSPAIRSISPIPTVIIQPPEESENLRVSSDNNTDSEKLFDPATGNSANTPGTPACSEASAKDAYYTGHGDPEITPVPRIMSRGIQRTLKTFLHTPSLSPRQIVQERHRIRRHSFMTTRISAATPKTQTNTTNGAHGPSNEISRTRHASEGDVRNILSTVTNVGQLRYKRYQVKEFGTHECDGNPFNLSGSSLLDKRAETLRDTLQEEIKSAILNASPDITPGQSQLVSTEMFWHPNEISNTSEEEWNPNAHDLEGQSLLKVLLASINKHVSTITNQKTRFNGIQLIYSFDRSARIPLKDKHKDESTPFVVLHIGRSRDLSITPLRFNPATQVTEVCDVILGNYSILTMFPGSSSNLHSYFSPETDANTRKEEQVLIVPFLEQITSDQPDSGQTRAGQGALPEPKSGKDSSPDDGPSLNRSDLHHTKTVPDVAPMEPNAPCDPLRDVPHGVQDCKHQPNDHDAIPDLKQATPSSPNEASVITFKYITLDLLKRAVNSHKKASLSSLMTSLGLKDSNNVTNNKAKLCNFLDTCVTKGHEETPIVIPQLINKIDDTTIKLELLANDLIPLGPSAHDRKKDLIKFCLDQCDYTGEVVRTKLVFNFGQADTSVLNQQPELQTGPPTSCNATDRPVITSETPLRLSKDKHEHNPQPQSVSPNDKKSSIKRSKKKKTKTKRSKETEPFPQNELPSHSHCHGKEPAQETTNTAPSGDNEEEVDLNTENEKFREPRNCNGCNELKQSMLVLQDSLLVLKEEMLQQKAIAELVISTPNPSDKTTATLVNKKLGPVEAKLNQLKADLDVLRMTVEQQNSSLETVMNKMKTLEALNKNQDQLKRNLVEFHAINLSNRDRIETLEIGQDNLKKSIHNLLKPVSDCIQSAAPPYENGSNNNPATTEATRANRRVTWNNSSLPSSSNQFTVVTGNNAKNHRETVTPSSISSDESTIANHGSVTANAPDNGSKESHSRGDQSIRPSTSSTTVSNSSNLNLSPSDSNSSSRDFLPSNRDSHSSTSSRDSHSSNRDSHSSNRDSHSSNRDSHSSTRDSHSSNRDSHSSNRDSHSSNRDSHSSNRDSHSSNRDSHSSNRDSHSSSRDSHSSNRDSHSSNRDSHSSTRDSHSSNRDSHSSNRDSHSSNRDSHSSNRDSHSSNRDSHSSNRDSHSSNRDSHSSNRDSHSSNRDSHSSNRDSHSSNRDSHSSNRDSHSTNRDSHSSSRESSTSARDAVSENREPDPLIRDLTDNSADDATSQSDTYTYRRHTVLLIHDDHFNEFDKKLFNKRFNVHLFQANSYSALEQKSNQLNAVIRRIRPECIYIHTGMNDFIKRKSGLVNYVEDLAELLLKKTEAQIGFSLLIPSTNSELNSKIKVVNDDIKHYVTWLHSISSRAKGRLFTYSNNSLGRENSHNPNTGFKLSTRGQNLLWLHLREGLKKTMRLPRTRNSSSETRTRRRSSNRFDSRF